MKCSMGKTKQGGEGLCEFEGGNLSPLDYQVGRGGGERGIAASPHGGLGGRASVKLNAGSHQYLLTTSLPPHPAQIVPNFRVRSIPVLGTTPALFGMAAASYVLCHLAGVPWLVGGTG